MSGFPLAPADEGPILPRKDFSLLIEAAQATSDWLERLATMPEDERRAVTLSAIQKRATVYNSRLRDALAAAAVPRSKEMP